MILAWEAPRFSSGTAAHLAHRKLAVSVSRAGCLVNRENHLAPIFVRKASDLCATGLYGERMTVVGEWTWLLLSAHDAVCSGD